MFSPVKAITAGALIFALGGLFLVAQPFDQQGSVPGAEQGAELAPPVKVTANFSHLDCGEGSGGTEGSFEVDGPVERMYGQTCTVHREWSDPRLQGTETSIVNGVEYRWDDNEFFIAHYVHDIVTDEGAWRMRPQFRFDAETRYSSGIWVLDGEDAYEGLSVVLAMDAHTFAPLTGYIISTDLVPPAPEGASTK